MTSIFRDLALSLGHGFVGLLGMENLEFFFHQIRHSQKKKKSLDIIAGFSFMSTNFFIQLCPKLWEELANRETQKSSKCSLV